MLGLVWTPGILALLLLLLCLLRVGVRVELNGAQSTVELRIGPFHFRVFPGKMREEKSVNPEEVPEKAEEKPKKNAIKLPPLTALRDLLRTLWPPLRRALARTRREIRIDLLQLSVTVGGEEDPAAAAQHYGELNGAVWAVMPVLEQLLTIHEPYIHIGIDFDAVKTRVEGSFGLSIRIGTVLALAFGIGIPAIRWLLRQNQKTQKKRPSSPDGPRNSGKDVQDGTSCGKEERAEGPDA